MYLKCFERLVKSFITSSLPDSLDPLQFAYRANRSTEDAIATALHTTLQHVEHEGSYARLLFIDFSSAFNTIIPNRLLTKLMDLGLSQPICYWIKDFLTERSQRVRVGAHLSSALSISTGSPQGCVLSPLLYTLYTNDCIPSHPAIPSLSLRMIQRWWGSSQVGMRLHIGRRSKDCLHGVRRTTSSSTPQRPKS